MAGRDGPHPEQGSEGLPLPFPQYRARVAEADIQDALTLAGADPGEALRGEAPSLIDEWQNAPQLWNRIRRECDDRARPTAPRLSMGQRAASTSCATRSLQTGEPTSPVSSSSPRGAPHIAALTAYR